MTVSAQAILAYVKLASWKDKDWKEGFSQALKSTANAAE